MQKAAAVLWARDSLKAKRSEETQSFVAGSNTTGSDAVGVWNVGRTFFAARLRLLITVNQLISAMAEICRDETEMVERKRARREGFFLKKKKKWPPAATV